MHRGYWKDHAALAKDLDYCVADLKNQSPRHTLHTLFLQSSGVELQSTDGWPKEEPQRRLGPRRSCGICEIPPITVERFSPANHLGVRAVHQFKAEPACSRSVAAPVPDELCTESGAWYFTYIPPADNFRLRLYNVGDAQ